MNKNDFLKEANIDIRKFIADALVFFHSHSGIAREEAMEYAAKKVVDDNHIYDILCGNKCVDYLLLEYEGDDLLIFKEIEGRLQTLIKEHSDDKRSIQLTNLYDINLTSSKTFFISSKKREGSLKELVVLLKPIHHEYPSLKKICSSFRIRSF